MPGAHETLAELLAAVADGQFPPADGRTVVVPQPNDRDAGVISFTGHSVVFADTDPGWVAAQLPDGALSEPLSARFLHSLGTRLGRRSHSVDLLACAESVPGPPRGDFALAEIDSGSAAPGAPGADSPHPRLVRARWYRDDVRAWETPGGLLTIGRGVAARWEVAVEVDPDWRGRGLGAGLAAAARHLVPAGAPLWAQIAPANAASVRAFLRAGYRPAGAEALLSIDGPA